MIIFNKAQLEAAHKRSINHRSEILASTLCGCFDCLETFAPSAITEWVDHGDATALCPHCAMDSVLGDKSDYPITRDFLHAMHQRWFETEAS